MNFADLAAVVPAEGERQAALLLHAMAPEDRAWLIAQLDAPKRQRLFVLLEELAGLGIPADPYWLESAGLASSAIAAEPEAPATHGEAADSVMDDRSYLARLDTAGVAALASHLLHEPPQLVARCMQCGPWPWQRELVSQLPAQMRMLVAEVLRDGAGTEAVDTAPALQVALLRAMRSRCVPGAAKVDPTVSVNHGRAAQSPRGTRFMDRLLRRGAVHG